MPESAQHEAEDQQGRTEETDQEQGNSQEQQSGSSPDKDPAEELLINHLMEIHALEEQGAKQLQGALELTDDDELRQLFEDHLEQTREHEKLVSERIEARDVKPSAIKDLTMQAAATVGLRSLEERPEDTPVKMAMHMYTFENLEIVTYDFLIRFAKAAGDDETVEVAEKILDQERETAERVCGLFDHVVSLLGESSSESDHEDSSDAEDSDSDA